MAGVGLPSVSAGSPLLSPPNGVNIAVGEQTSGGTSDKEGAGGLMSPSSSSVDVGSGGGHSPGWVSRHPALISLTFCVILFSVGLIVWFVGEKDHPTSVAAHLLWTAGAFGIFGGFMNWLAVLLLFKRVPLLIGSGVIPRNFVAIRSAIGSVVTETFLDDEFLRRAVSQKSGELMHALRLDESLRRVLESDEISSAVDARLKDFSGRPEGTALAMQGISLSELSNSVIKPLLLSTGAELAPLLMASVDPSSEATYTKFRQTVEGMMQRRLQELSPEETSGALKRTVGTHMGWLVLWGCTFGVIIGFICEGVAISLSYRC